MEDPLHMDSLVINIVREKVWINDYSFSNDLIFLNSNLLCYQSQKNLKSYVQKLERPKKVRLRYEGIAKEKYN